MGADRWTIADLIARYTLEPSIRDVFVEGTSDRVLLGRALAGLLSDVDYKVYEISTVDVPASQVLDLSLKIGNKGRVVALACAIERSHLPRMEESVVCLADVDLDRLRDRCKPSKVLVYTTHLSLDSLLVTENTVDRLFALAFQSELPAAVLFDQMLPVLHERVLQRAALDELEIDVSPPSIGKCCRYAQGVLSVDLDAFLTRHLDKASAAGRRPEVDAAVERYRVRAVHETLAHMDDFLEIVHFCGGEIRPQATPGLQQLRRILPALVVDDDLFHLPEVQDVARRVARCA
jgi:hypothetical protein